MNGKTTAKYITLQPYIMPIIPHCPRFSGENVGQKNFNYLYTLKKVSCATREFIIGLATTFAAKKTSRHASARTLKVLPQDDVSGSRTVENLGTNDSSEGDDMTNLKLKQEGQTKSAKRN